MAVTYWANRPKNAYIIETDQGTYQVEAYRLDYKETIKQMRNQGYTNIKINFIGRAIHYTYH